MAKLPEITRRRGVQPLRAPDTSRGDIAELRAASQVIGGAVKTVDDLMENESRLDARRRFNAAQRDYATQAQEITQRYHSDRDLPVENYLQDMTKARENAFADARRSAGGRTMKHIEPQLDQYRTALHSSEVEALAKLTESRSIMHLNDLQEDTLDRITMDPGSMNAEVALALTAADESGLSAPLVEEFKDKTRAAAAQVAITQWGREGDLQAMDQFIGSKAFLSMSLEQQEAARKQAAAVSQQLWADEMQEVSNQLVMGEVGWDVAYARTQARAQHMPGMSDEQKTRFARDAGSEVAGHYFNGLMARQQYGTMLTELQGQKFRDILTPTQHAEFLSRAHAGTAQKTSVAMNEMANRVRNGMAEVAAGRGSTSELMADLSEFKLANPGMTATQQNQVEMWEEQLGIWNDVASELESMPHLSRDELEEADANAKARLDAYEGDHFIVAQQAQQAIAQQAQARRTAMDKDIVTYSAIHDPNTRQWWDETNDALNAALTAETPEEAQLFADQAAMNYAIYKRHLDGAVSNYGYTKAPVEIPLDNAAASRIAQTLASSRQGTIGGIGFLRTVFGDDAYDIGAQITAEDPGVGTAAMFDVYGQLRERDAVLAGRQRIANLGDNLKVKRTDLTDPDKNAGVVVPITAVGNYSEQALEAMFVYAVGIAPEREVLSGDFSQDTLTRARDAIFGEPFKANEYSEYAIPWRDENGLMVNGSDVQGRFRALRNDPTLHTGPTPRNIQGEEVDLQAALNFATPVLVGPGQYRLDIPSSSPLGTSGYLLDANGDPYIIDVRSVPADSSYIAPLAVEQLQGGRR